MGGTLEKELSAQSRVVSCPLVDGAAHTSASQKHLCGCPCPRRFGAEIRDVTFILGSPPPKQSQCNPCCSRRCVARAEEAVAPDSFYGHVLWLPVPRFTSHGPA